MLDVVCVSVCLDARCSCGWEGGLFCKSDLKVRMRITWRNNAPKGRVWIPSDSDQAASTRGRRQQSFALTKLGVTVSIRAGIFARVHVTTGALVGLLVATLPLRFLACFRHTSDRRRFNSRPIVSVLVSFRQHSHAASRCYGGTFFVADHRCTSHIILACKCHPLC